MLSLVSRARLWTKIALKTALVLPGLLHRLFSGPQPGEFRALFYHRVNPYPFEKLGPISREITVRPEVFARQLDHLRKLGYRTLSPRELQDLLDGKAPAADGKAIVITFDDGYEDNLLWAAPLLRAHDFQAIVFVITDLIGKENCGAWTGSDPVGFGRFLSREQLRGMTGNSMFVESHTRSHRLLTSLDETSLRAELTESRRALEEIIDSPVRLFAYPLGDFDHRSEAAAAQAGYAASFTTVPGLNRPGIPRHALRRTEVSASDTMFLFRMKVGGALDWLWFKEAPGLRRAIGATNRWLLRLFAR